MFKIALGTQLSILVNTLCMTLNNIQEKEKIAQCVVCYEKVQYILKVWNFAICCDLLILSIMNMLYNT